ncbi:MAG: hypothetical protein BIFFINMI_03581 [Phycisphaerae bacterium]|nr:hypothetical protein [Phycisphaerae bacterium]
MSDALTPEQQEILDGLTDSPMTAAGMEPQSIPIATREQWLIHAVLTNPDLMQRAQDIDPRAFVVRTHKPLWTFLCYYYRRHGALPSVAIIKNEIQVRWLQSTDSNAALRLHEELESLDRILSAEIASDDLGYVADLIDYFCKISRAAAVYSAMERYKERPTDRTGADLDGAIRNWRQGGKSEQGQAYTIPELWALPASQWLIGSHAHQGAYLVIYGPYSTGKSFWAIDAGLSLATGTPFLGRFTTARPTPVVYVASEAHIGLSKRIRAWIQTHETPVPDTFLLVAHSFHFATDLTAPDTLAEMIKNKWGDMRPGLVVVDTLNRNFGGDENSAEDMTAFTDAMARLQSILSGCTVAVVHHTGKDTGKGARGSSALLCAADFAIEMRGSSILEGIEVRCEKSKDDAPFAPYIITGHSVEVGNGDTSLALTYASTAAEKRQQEVAVKSADDMDTLADAIRCGADTYEALRNELGWSSGKMHRTLTKLQSAGVISIDSGENNRKRFSTTKNTGGNT